MPPLSAVGISGLQAGEDVNLRTITFDDEQWQVVPKQLTPEMLGAALWPACLSTDYALALAAAPEPPAQEPMTEEEIASLSETQVGTAQFLVAKLHVREAERHHGIGKGESK